MSHQLHVVQDKYNDILAGQEPSIWLSNPSQAWIWENVYMWLNYNIVGPQSKSSVAKLPALQLSQRKKLSKY